MQKEFRELFSCIGRVAAILTSKQRIRLVVALCLMAIAGALTNVPPVVLGKLLDSFVLHHVLNFKQTWTFLAFIMGATLVREAMQVLRKYLIEGTCTQVEKDMRISSVRHLLRVDLSFFSMHQIGSLHGRLSRSIDGLVKLIKLSFLDFLPSIFVAAFALGVVFFRAPLLLGLAMALVVPISLLVVVIQVASQKGIRIGLLRGKEKIDGTLVELLSGLENVRAMHTGRFETNRVENVSEELRHKEMVHHVWMAVFDAWKYVNEGLFHVVVLAVSLWLASNGQISTGDVLTYSILFAGVIAPLREVHRILDESHESSIRTRDLFGIMDIPEDRSFNTISSISANMVPNFQSDIAVRTKGLCFTFPDSDSPAVKDLDLTVREGEFLGICGPAGCGKSTLLRVLLRIIHPDSGEIILLGRNLLNYKREELAQMIGYVSQYPFLVSGTVFQNIAYGMCNAPPEIVNEAARKANIHEEILNFPMSYNTQVGERGCNLSGGQRQRIALARVFLRSPSLLLLDEATAALDNINEMAVQTAVEEAMIGRTVISVAHRLTTLRSADRIIVMEKGGIAESGTYLELLTSGGLFSHLAKASMLQVDESLVHNHIQRSA